MTATLERTRTLARAAIRLGVAVRLSANAGRGYDVHVEEEYVGAVDARTGEELASLLVRSMRGRIRAKMKAAKARGELMSFLGLGRR